MQGGDGPGEAYGGASATTLTQGWIDLRLPLVNAIDGGVWAGQDAITHASASTKATVGEIVTMTWLNSWTTSIAAALA